MRSSSAILALLAALPLSAWSFNLSPLSPSSSLPLSLRPRSAASTSTSSALFLAKKKKTRSSGGEGFAKSTAPSSPSNDSAMETLEDAVAASSPRALQSINTSANNAVSTSMSTSSMPSVDPSLPPEERSQQILREKYNLRSYEEQQGDINKIIASQEKQKQREKLRNIEKLWPEDKDLFAVLPPELLRGVDLFLKTGLGISTMLFVLAGVFITIEAGSKATGKELPGGLEEFVVNVVEPNFTPGLGVLLAFSVSLGIFSAAQLSSAGSTYREDP